MALTCWMSTCIGGKWDPYFTIYIIINSKWITRHNRGATERQKKAKPREDRSLHAQERSRGKEREINWLVINWMIFLKEELDPETVDT